MATIGISHKEITHMNWAIGLANLQRPMPCAFSLSKGQPWDVSRNAIVKDAIANGSTHLLFIDSDVVPPPDAFERLLKHNLPVISGLYYCRHRTDMDVGNLPIALPPVPAMWLDNGQGSYAPITRWNSQLVQCAVVGAGFLLIHMSVFQRLDNELNRNGSYFKWTSGINNTEYEEGKPGVSEDFFFCRLLGELGIPIYVDTTIKCQHMLMAGVIDERGIDFSSI